MAAVMCVCMLFASCGESEKGGSEGDVSFSQKSESNTSSRQASESEAADNSGRQVLTLEINNDKKPELTKVELSGKCSGDIERKPLEYFSFKQKQTAETPVKETFHLTLNPDCTITRDEHKEFNKKITWHVELDGVEILERSAEKELTLETQYQWLKGSEGIHRVYLVAHDGNGYVRVSNIIEYVGTEP